MSQDTTHEPLLTFPRQVPQPHGHPTEPGEIRWTYGNYNGCPFVKAQIFSHGRDGKTRYVDAGITIKFREIDDVIKALQDIRPRMKGATGSKPASSQASRSRSVNPGDASQTRTKGPVARPRSQMAPEPAARPFGPDDELDAHRVDRDEK